MCAFAGGVLGVLMMVPLRRALIVKEHGALPYPEGTACADVLVAGEQGGNMAKAVFMGLGVGAAWKGLSWIVQLTRTAIGYTMARGSFFPNATLNVDISPGDMGVGRHRAAHRRGHVRRRRAACGWCCCRCSHGGHGRVAASRPCLPAAECSARMTAGEIWRAIRYTGAALALPRRRPPWPSDAADHRLVVPRQREGPARRQRRAAPRSGTEQDTPMLIVVGGTLALARSSSWPKLPTYGGVWRRS
jgi:hypothetical protein